jgi:transposase
MKKTRRRISAGLKAEIALEAMRERSSTAEVAERYGVHSNQVYLWKKRLRARAACVFDPLIAHLGKTSREL